LKETIDKFKRGKLYFLLLLVWGPLLAIYRLFVPKTFIDDQRKEQKVNHIDFFSRNVRNFFENKLRVVFTSKGKSIKN